MTEIKLQFGNVETAKNNFKEKIEPGVSEVEITSVTLEEYNGKQYVSVKCVNLAGTREHEERMYLSTEKAVLGTTARLKHLIEVVTGNEPSKDGSIAGVNKVLKGKKVRIKFVGEEYINKDGNVSVKASFAYKGFAESLDVASENTGLKYNPGNKYDYKPVVKPEDAGVDYPGDLGEAISIDDNVF